jgi:hypothetical protein
MWAEERTNIVGETKVFIVLVVTANHSVFT